MATPRFRRLLWPVGLLCTAVVITALAGWAWSGRDAAASSGQWVAVQDVSNPSTVQADGQIQPAEVIQLTAPFDGKILKKTVQVGDAVTQGALLFEMDPSDIMAEKREAEMAHQRAQDTLEDLKHWGTQSPEVLGLRRQWQRSQNNLGTAMQRLQDTQRLYDHGIVARDELDMVRAEVDNARVEHASLTDNLQATLKKGSGSALSVAELDAQNRSDKLTQINQRLKQAAVKAPITGVVLYPALELGPNATKEPTVGSFVTSREAVVTLGDVTKFKVVTALDEVDIARVKPGLQAQVTIGTDDPLVLPGVLQHISSQAKRDLNQNVNAPVFEIQVLMSQVPPDALSRIKLGMTAHLVIDTQPSTLSGLSVPLSAVHVEEGKTWVLARSAGQSASTQKVVKIAKSLVDQVIITEGLSKGDEVFVPAAPSTEPGATADE